jgi:uncharacterized repeat protein (TIGR01451 family)
LDVISYSIRSTTVGGHTLTGITITDPLVSYLTYVSGDADNDGKPSRGGDLGITPQATRVTQNGKIFLEHARRRLTGSSRHSDG